MYKVVIADDELWVLRGLEGIIDWNSMEFEIAAKCSNGSEALTKVLEYEPDLLITDIRMPELSGIDLMNIIHQKNKHMKFVVISGYSEFDYALNALQVGAVDYLLKPITEDNLSRVLDKVKGILDKDKQKKTENENAIEDILEFFQNINSSLTEDIIIDRLGIQGRFPHYFCAVAPITLEHPHLISNTLLPYVDIYRFSIDKENILYIFNLSPPHENLIIKSLFQYADTYETHIGISEWIDSILQIPAGIEQARSAFYQYFIDGQNAIYHYKKDTLSTIGLLINEFNHSISHKHIEQLHRILDQIPIFLKTHHLTIKSVVMLYNHIISQLTNIRVLQSTGIEQSLEFLDSSQLISKFGTCLEMVTALHDKINLVFGGSEGPFSQSNDFSLPAKSLIYKVKQYIDENFRLDISLGKLAEKFFVNEQYLSQLFKAETGMNFSSYLTKVRVEHARFLLANTHLSIQDISQLCGYNDSFYFSKVFKKQMKVTPSRYRKK